MTAGYATRLFRGFGTLLGDLWHGRRWCARLAAASRCRVLLIECTVLAVVCGGYYFARYEAGAARRRAAMARTSSELRAVMLDLEAKRGDLAATRQRREFLKGFVLDKEAQARLLSSITNAEAHPRLEFLSMLPLPKENVGSYARCRTRFSVRGAFGDFLAFLRRLEAEAVPCLVVQLDVESSGKEGEPEKISFLLETYALADPEPAEARRAP